MKFILGIFILFLFSESYANPADPTRGYCQTVDPSACGWGGGSSQQHTPKRVINIPTHWGAVAIDPNKGIAGVSEDQKSKRAAKKQAIQACENRGGQNCKITGFAKNACIAYGQAITRNPSSPVPVRTGNTIKEAESEVQEACKKAGAIECRIYYSHCNKDPRYDMY